MFHFHLSTDSDGVQLGLNADALVLVYELEESDLRIKGNLCISVFKKKTLTGKIYEI